MIVTVASFKGGQAKTTTAVHLAALMNAAKPILLVDGDPNRSATSWNRRKGFPFRVVDEKQAVRFAKEFDHVVIDTQARPTKEDLKELAEGRDLLIVPLTPDALSLDTLFLFTDAFMKLGANRFKVLLTIVPPKPSRDEKEVLTMLREAGLPFFKTVIRRYKAFQKAALDGVLVSDVADTHAADAWADYMNDAKEVLP